MNYKKKTYTYEEALISLQKYCIYQDRSHMEVEKKLKEMSMIPEVVNKIIISLIEQDYLNEERFAFNYARGKFKLKNGLLTSFFLINYGLSRIIIENFRVPDIQVGLKFNLLSQGQLLSIPIVILGFYFLYLCQYKQR